MKEKLTMALVDDERHITEHLEKLIEKYFSGLFDVITATGAEEIIELLKRKEISVIISDIKMEGLTGLEFMRYICENYPQTKFLFFSAYPNFEYVYEANRHNIKYLLKIEEDDVIVQTIADLLSTDKRSTDTVEFGEGNTLIRFLTDYVDKHYDTDLSLELLAGLVHFNPSYLSRIFKQYTGKNVFEYVNAVRMRASEELLRETDYKISEIAEMTGYKTPNYFCYVFRSFYGVSPQAYRRREDMKKE